MEMTKGLSLFIGVVCLDLFSQGRTAGRPFPFISDSQDGDVRGDFIRLGTKWHVILMAVTYDIASTIVYENPAGSGQAPQSILELTKTLPETINHAYPCQTLLITEAEQLLEYQYNDGNKIPYNRISAKSKLCGTVSSIFAIPMPIYMVLGSESFAPWWWKMRSHPEFKINVTFLYIHVAMTSQCITLQASVFGGPGTGPINMIQDLLGVFCPD